MKNWLRKRLDNYEGRAESRDEAFAALVGRHIEAMSDRRSLRVYAVISASVNCLIWLSVLIVPRDVAFAWQKVFDLEPKIGGFVIAGIPGLGLLLTYSLIRLKFPDVEDVDLDSDVFSTLEYNAKANRRFWVWIFAATGGILNVIALVLAAIVLRSG